MNWNPTLKFSSKLIKLENILIDDEAAVQSRQAGVDQKQVDVLARSIRDIDLKQPISVEVKDWDETNPEYSLFVLRDGSHRYHAYTQLRDDPKNKNTTNWDQIQCVVYEKHDSEASELDWLSWQYSENQHLEKIHLKNSTNDTVYTIYKLLTGGYLNKSVVAKITNNNWDSIVENTIRDFININCKGSARAWRDDVVRKVYDKGGQSLSEKIKRYSRTEIKNILEDEYQIKKGKSGSKSPNTNTTVWVATNDDWWTKALSPVARIFKEGVKSGQNHIIFHSKQEDVKNIEARRKSLVVFASQINSWFGANVPGFKNIKVIDEVKVLGQKLSDEYGEEANEFVV
tara:strand:+ start:2679 stop:3707 length:1029 start_codon:yes stop_codon:yes gene_type:complete